MTFPVPGLKSSEVLSKMESFQADLSEFAAKYTEVLGDTEATSKFREDFGNFIVREISNATVTDIEGYVHLIWDELIDKIGHDPLNIKFTIILKLAELVSRKK